MSKGCRGQRGEQERAAVHALWRASQGAGTPWHVQGQSKKVSGKGEDPGGGMPVLLPFRQES